MNDTLKKMKQAELHPGPLPLSGAWFSFNKPHLSGCLGGSAVERLPLAQVLGSSPPSGSSQGACFSLCLCLCLSPCVSHE